MMQSDPDERSPLNDDPRASKPANDLDGSRTSATIPQYRYCDLGGTSREILIEHEGQLYRLRTTRNGKLILNK